MALVKARLRPLIETSKAQADAEEIICQADIRLANEYDDAQERGEVVGAHNGATKRVLDQNAICPATTSDLGLSRKDIHEARQVRDAEKLDPGIVRRTLDDKPAFSAAMVLDGVPPKSAIFCRLFSVGRPIRFPIFDSIAAAIATCSDDIAAEMAMIDENLCRSDLSPAERARSVARRKVLYETRYPQTEHGAIGNGREKSRQVGDSTFVDRFTASTAAATSTAERTIQREAARGAAILPEALAAVAATPLDTGRYLDTLKSVPKEEQVAPTQPRTSTLLDAPSPPSDGR